MRINPHGFGIAVLPVCALSLAVSVSAAGFDARGGPLDGALPNRRGRPATTVRRSPRQRARVKPSRVRVTPLRAPGVRRRETIPLPAYLGLGALAVRQELGVSRQQDNALQGASYAYLKGVQNLSQEMAMHWQGESPEKHSERFREATDQLRLIVETESTRF